MGLSDGKEGSNFDILSPTIQLWMKRALGVGVSFYLGYVIITSPEVKYLARSLRKWKESRLKKRQESEFNNDSEEDDDDSLTSSFQSMDSRVRQKLLAYVSPSDLKNLRLVCKNIQYEIDRFIGLYIRLNCQSIEQRHWVRGKAIQSCVVENIEVICKNGAFLQPCWMLFCKPSILTELRIHESSSITPKILNDITTTFLNLRKLVVYFEDTLDSDSGCCLNGQILNNIGVLRQQISTLAVDYVTDTKSYKWVLVFKRISPNSIPPRDDKTLPNLKKLRLQLNHYSRPNNIQNSKDKFFWKIFLDSQKDLTFIAFDFGPVCWQIYASIVRKNSSTLEKLHLSNIACWDGWCSTGNHDSTFNWNIFEKSSHLSCLTLIASPELQNGPLVYTAYKCGALNLTYLHADLGNIHWSLYASFIMANSATLESITLCKLTNLNPATGDESSFDWGIMENCQNLTFLSLSGREFSYMKHSNISTIPRTIQKLDVKWFSFKKKHIDFLAKSLKNLEVDENFLEWCSIIGLNTVETFPIEYFLQVRNCKQFFSVDNLIAAYQAFPLPIIDTFTIIWLIFA